MNFEWILQKQANIDEIRILSSQLNNIKFSLANILIKRGIKNFDDAKKFFRPDLSNLYDPFLMKGMLLAVERIEKQIVNNKRILVYGDYDVDGTTSVALMYKFLNFFSDNILYYVPDRYTEGYGISYQGIDFAQLNDIDLIIALDCGIKSVDKIEYANDKKIDFIICDHHTPGSIIPNAIAVLNPKQIDCQYPFKELSGCGVGFKLCQAYLKYKNLDESSLLELLDLVAVSIASDIVPIIDENRILEYFGLKQLEKTTNSGLQALLDISDMKGKPITVSDVVFKIGPRINAAGRMKHASFSVNLLVEDNVVSAKEFADMLNEYNEQRKINQESIIDDILQIIEKNPNLLHKKSAVLYDENWNKGIVGIVASKVVEKYYKPTIVLTKSNNKWTGSARSVENFDLYKAIDLCGKYLLSYGGHKFAAGLTLEENMLKPFIEEFENIVSHTITEDQLDPKLFISDKISFADIDSKFVSILNQLAPFGPENMRPVFWTSDVRDTGMSKQIGKDFSHLRLELVDKNDIKFSAIAFGMGYLFDIIKQKVLFDICYNIEEVTFNNNVSIQLEIKDIRFNFKY